VCVCVCVCVCVRACVRACACVCACVGIRIYIMYLSRRPVSTSASQLQMEGYEKRNKKMGRPLSPSLAILAKK
jgi:hypothetical protein